MALLKHKNGSKHVGDSHAPGVNQTKTLPPEQRHWAGMLDDKAAAVREAERSRQGGQQGKLDPVMEAEYARNVAHERRVLASDPQSWAYLSLQKMAAQQEEAGGGWIRDASALSAQHKAHHPTSQSKPYTAAYRLGERKPAKASEGGAGAEHAASGRKVSFGTPIAAVSGM